MWSNQKYPRNTDDTTASMMPVDKREEEEEDAIELYEPCSSKVVHIRTSSMKHDGNNKRRAPPFPGLGLILAFLASIFFSSASLTIKLISNVHPMSILFGRSVIQLVIFIPVCIFNNYRILGERNERLALFGRIIFGSMAISGLYYSVRIMPLADASTIVFSSPAFTGIFACIFLKEPCGFFEASTVVCVLVGVVLICKPTFIFGGSSYNYQLEGTLAATNSAINQALVFVCMRKMKNTPSSVIIVTFSVVVAIVCTVVLFFLDTTIVPTCGYESALYLACGLFSSAGQFLITAATKFEKAGPLSVVRTTDIIMAFLFQISFLGDYPKWTSFVGASIVCLTVLILGLKQWYGEKSLSLACCRRDRTESQQVQA